MISKTKIFGLIATLSGCLLFSGPALSNSAFAEASRKPCSACHIEGQETDGRRGLNQTGLTVYESFRDNNRCNYVMRCAIDAAFGGNRDYSNNNSNFNQNREGDRRPQLASAKFEDSCNVGDSFYEIRAADSGQKTFFVLKNRHIVHMWVAPGSTFAVRCGDWPGNNGYFKTIALER